MFCQKKPKDHLKPKVIVNYTLKKCQASIWYQSITEIFDHLKQNFIKLEISYKRFSICDVRITSVVSALLEEVDYNFS